MKPFSEKALPKTGKLERQLKKAIKNGVWDPEKREFTFYITPHIDEAKQEFPLYQKNDTQYSQADLLWQVQLWYDKWFGGGKP